MNKKIISTVICLTAAAVMIGGCSFEQKKEDETAGSGNTLVIYCFNNDFQQLFLNYVSDIIPENVNVKFMITDNNNGEYQDKLDNILPKQASLDQSEKIDLFLMQEADAEKYADSDYTLDVRNDLGITDDDLGDQYDYTKQFVTDGSGRLKALTWQAAPGFFAYRRSIAKDVIGTDDPAAVGEALSDWDKFAEAAADAKKKGYFMLSGYNDSYRAYAGSTSSPWIDENGKISIAPELTAWVKQTEDFSKNGYNDKTSIGDEKWSADMGEGGKVFGYFLSAPEIGTTLQKNSLKIPEESGGKLEKGNGSYGDWGVCTGPQNYFCGGTWIAAAAGTDNKDLATAVMKRLTCDKDILKMMTEKSGNFTNTMSGMKEIAASDYTSELFGGQNHITLLESEAEQMKLENVTAYDNYLDNRFEEAMDTCFTGANSEDDALKSFYDTVKKRYPQIVN